jgi:protein-tyrosine phosphatase
VPTALRDARITAVCNCTEVSNDLDPTEFRCLRLNQPDGAAIYPEVLRGFFDWMMLARRDHLSVLIHCREGISRAPSFTIAWLMWCGLSWDAGEWVVRSARPQIRPHAELRRSILEYFGRCERSASEASASCS